MTAVAGDAPMVVGPPVVAPPGVDDPAGAGPAATRTTDEQTVHVATASRAAGALQTKGGRAGGAVQRVTIRGCSRLPSPQEKGGGGGQSGLGEAHPLRRFAQRRSRVLVVSPWITSEEQRGQKRRCTLSEIAARQASGRRVIPQPHGAGAGAGVA